MMLNTSPIKRKKYGTSGHPSFTSLLIGNDEVLVPLKHMVDFSFKKNTNHINELCHHAHFPHCTNEKVLKDLVISFCKIKFLK
jgi:hypothetical protein